MRAGLRDGLKRLYQWGEGIHLGVLTGSKANMGIYQKESQGVKDGWVLFVGISICLVLLTIYATRKFDTAMQHTIIHPGSAGIQERSNPPSEAPAIKKVSWVSEATPSSDEHFPYGLKITIQTSVPISPVDLVVECTGDIGRITSWYLGEPGMLMATMVRAGVHGRTCELGFDSPAVTPQKPLVIILISTEKIAVKNIFTRLP